MYDIRQKIIFNFDVKLIAAAHQIENSLLLFYVFVVHYRFWYRWHVALFYIMAIFFSLFFRFFLLI